MINNKRRSDVIEFYGGALQIRRNKSEEKATTLVALVAEFKNHEYGVQIQITSGQTVGKADLPVEHIPEVIEFMLGSMPEKERGEMLLELKALIEKETEEPKEPKRPEGRGPF